MNVTVNGIEKKYPEGTTVLSLVESEGMDPQRVAVEIDMDIVPRKTYSDREITNGEKIEIVSFVGGG